jgi:hypothetical protein
MANDETVALLKDGASAWNAWRKTHDEGPDLSSAALRGTDLSGYDLSRADLRGADLRGTKLCDSDLSRARLSTGPTSPGRSCMARNSSIVRNLSSPETGNRPSAMTRSAAAQRFQTGRDNGPTSSSKRPRDAATRPGKSAKGSGKRPIL